MGSAGSPTSGLSFNTFIFPNGGNWTSEQPQDPFLDVLEEEFKSLEEYLRAKQGTEIKKK